MLPHTRSVRQQQATAIPARQCRTGAQCARWKCAAVVAGPSQPTAAKLLPLGSFLSACEWAELASAVVQPPTHQPPLHPLIARPCPCLSKARMADSVDPVKCEDCRTSYASFRLGLPPRTPHPRLILTHLARGSDWKYVFAQDRAARPLGGAEVARADTVTASGVGQSKVCPRPALCVATAHPYLAAATRYPAVCTINLAKTRWCGAAAQGLPAAVPHHRKVCYTVVDCCRA